MAETLKYGEVFLYAKHGETYEIVDSTVIEVIGEKVSMKETSKGNLIMKKEGTHTSKNANDIIVPHGAITGAIFKKVVEYEKVKLGYVLDALHDGGQDVFIKREHFDGEATYEKINTYTYLDSGYSIYDFGDLMNTDFYILK
jgi:hypothetical protein